jgi:non-SMC mitotic condensation complex subunit 1
LIESQGFVEQLYRMMQDNDANVLTNVIYVLNEVLLSKGGIEVNQTMILSLLNRISEFSEWGLNNILDLVSRCSPRNEEEGY